MFVYAATFVILIIILHTERVQSLCTYCRRFPPTLMQIMSAETPRMRFSKLSLTSDAVTAQCFHKHVQNSPGSLSLPLQ